MTPILLSPGDIAIASVLILLDGVLSIVLRLGLHWQLGIAAGRMAVQLVLVGFILRAVFAIGSPWLTLLVVLVMVAIAGREVAARPEQRLRNFGNYAVGASAVAAATFLTAMLALTTAIRPHPWYDPHYAIPLVGIVLGSVLNGGSLALDLLLGGVVRERAAVEAQLALGVSYMRAMRGLIRVSVRRGLLPTINQMAAAGYYYAAGNHDRPDPGRDGPAGGGEIPDPVDVPAVGGQWSGGRCRGVFGGVAADRRTSALASGPARRQASLVAQGCGRQGRGPRGCGPKDADPTDRGLGTMNAAE